MLLGGACNAILGIDEPVDRPADAGALGGSGAAVTGGTGGAAGSVSSGGVSGVAGAAGVSGAGSGGDASTGDAPVDPCGGCVPPTICQAEKCCNPGMPVSASDST